MKKRRRMRKLLMALLCVAGVGIGALFLKEEQRLEQFRQQQVAALSAQLQPLEAERRRWEKEEREWQKTLEAGKSGRPCVLLNFDSMDQNLYEIIYELMDQYGFRGTFALKNGRIPGENERDLSRKEFEELLFAGWEYAVSFGEEPKQETEELGYWERRRLEKQETQGEMESETGSEAETEAETESETEAEREKSMKERLDDAFARFEAEGIETPKMLFCEEEQYAKLSQAALTKREIQAAFVKQTEGFPVLTEREKKLWTIRCGICTQQAADVEEQLAAAVEKGESVALFINEVQKISKNNEYDLGLTRFTSLLNCLKRMEEEGKIYLITYTELAQYEEQQQKQYEDLLREYNTFREEREVAEKKLDQEETKLVDALFLEEPQESMFEKLTDRERWRNAAQNLLDHFR